MEQRFLKSRYLPSLSQWSFTQFYLLKQHKTNQYGNEPFVCQPEEFFVSLVNVKWFRTLNWTAIVGSGEQKQKWCWPLWRWKWARQRMIERLGSLLCYWHTGQWLPVVLISSTLYQNKHLKLEENTQKDSLKPCQARNSHRSRKFLKWVLWTRRVKDFLLPEL